MALFLSPRFVALIQLLLQQPNLEELYTRMPLQWPADDDNVNTMGSCKAQRLNADKESCYQIRCSISVKFETSQL